MNQMGRTNIKENKSSGRVILHTPEPSSAAALYVEELSTALASAGVPIIVVCPANHQAIPSLSKFPSITIRTCLSRDTRGEVSFFQKIVGNLRFVLSSALTLFHAAEASDIVHFQYILHLPFGLIFFLCAWLRRAHILFTVHDPVPHKFLFPRGVHWVELITIGWAYRWADALIVHSEAGKRKLIERFSVPAHKIAVIVHGPYRLNKEVRRCEETARLEVLFFGSLRENKAPHLAIEAVQNLAARGVPIRLTIAGQVVNRNEEAYWAKHRTLIDEKAGAVQLIERFVPDEALADLFSTCHCFVLPYTSFSSDSGVAYMAMANGKPIIATRAGGLGWLLEQSRGGIAIDEASVEGVTDALRKAVGIGPAAIERIGEAGLEWMLANCGWDGVARATRELYACWNLTLAMRDDTSLPTASELKSQVGAAG